MAPRSRSGKGGIPLLFVELLICFFLLFLLSPVSSSSSSSSNSSSSLATTANGCGSGEVYDAPPYTGVYFLDEACPGSSGVWSMKFSPPSVPYTYSSICLLLAISNVSSAGMPPSPAELDLPITIAFYRIGADDMPLQTAPEYSKQASIHITRLGPQWVADQSWQTINVDYNLFETDVFIGVYWHSCTAVVVIETCELEDPHPAFGRTSLESGEWMDLSFYAGALGIRAAGTDYDPRWNETIPGWNCSRRLYQDGQICNCFCGIDDPDCSLPSESAGGVGPISPDCPAAGQVCYSGGCVSPRWDTSLPHCNLSHFGSDEICDCGCGGLLDPDCLDESHPNSCPGFLQVCSLSDNQCSDTWTCDRAKYNDSHTCDCNCGASVDPDCLTNSPLPSTCPLGMKCGYTGLCLPKLWDCNDGWYNASDGCDCNCKVYDPDCDDVHEEVFECDYPLFCNYNSTCIEGFCGNHHAEAQLEEECDGGLGCSANCSCKPGFVPLSPIRQGCYSICGDGVWAEGAEECDGDPHCFRNNCTCFSAYHPAYPVSTGQCGVCGNKIIDPDEECDGGELCQSNCTCNTGSSPFTPPQLGCQQPVVVSADANSAVAGDSFLAGGKGIAVVIAILLCILAVCAVAFILYIIKKRRDLASGTHIPLPLNQLETVPDSGEPAGNSSAGVVLSTTPSVVDTKTTGREGLLSGTEKISI